MNNKFEYLIVIFVFGNVCLGEQCLHSIYGTRITTTTYASSYTSSCTYGNIWIATLSTVRDVGLGETYHSNCILTPSIYYTSCYLSGSYITGTLTDIDEDCNTYTCNKPISST